MYMTLSFQYKQNYYLYIRENGCQLSEMERTSALKNPDCSQLLKLAVTCSSPAAGKEQMVHDWWGSIELMFVRVSQMGTNASPPLSSPSCSFV